MYLTQNGVTLNTDNRISIPEEYWNGWVFVNSSELLPTFDVRLEMDAVKHFNAQDNFCVTLNFTGNLYYQSQPTESKVCVYCSLFTS